MITREDLEGIRIPIFMACVEDDPLFPTEVLQAGRKSLETNKVEHEIEVYSGVPHGKLSLCEWTTELTVAGFAVLGDYDDSKIKDAQRQAFGQLLGWLQSH